jgi:DNA-directed RNA polymerase specialized sigma24 family protein
LEHLPRAEDHPDAAAVALEAHSLGIDGQLRDGVRELKPKDAQLLVLVALEGYSVLEAAECLQLSESAARARLHRTRARLQKQLAGVELVPRWLIGQEEVR